MEVRVEGHCDDRFAAVREIFEASFASGEELGASVAFVVDGEMMVDLWGGFADEARTRPWRADTIANVFSTTKGLTALCAHQLVERGKIDLDAPVASLWPEFAQAGKGDIPVRWLLSHQAGLPAIRKPLPEGALFDWDLYCEALAEQEPWWEPGTRHGYHAVTFGHLVGELIRRASGLSVGEYLRENVSKPLGAEVHIGLTPELSARAADLVGEPLPRSVGGGGGSGKAAAADPFSRFLRDMRDPSTMVGAAFNNPRLGNDTAAQDAWRTAEIPAANGHASARGLAQVYGALARGGELGGVRLLEGESIDRAIEEQAMGPDAILAGMPIRYGLGFMLRQPFMPICPSPRGFGHPGAGGSIGAADPDAKVGYGYVPNLMKLGLMGGPNGFAMIKAFFKAL